MNFIQPFAAAAFVLAAAPLILHLFTRRRFTDVPFTALIFLKQSQRRSMTRLTLHHILALLCRMAAIAMLAAAFMMPAVKGARLAAVGGRPRIALAVVLDNTYSMGRRRGGVSAFDRARAAAVKVVSLANKDDFLLFVTPCADGPGAGGVSTGMEPEKLVAIVARTRISSCSKSLTEAINRASFELEKVGVAERRIIVLTDLQAHAFRGEVRKPEAGSPGMMFVNFGAVGDERTNIGISSVSAPMFPVRGAAAPLCFQLHGGSPGARPVISLYINGKTRGEQAVRIAGADAPGAKGCFRPVFDSPGLYSGEMRIQGDALPQDNRYFFTFEIFDRMKILLVANAKQLDDVSADAFYLRRALDSSSAAGSGGAPFETIATTLVEITPAMLRDVRVVVVPPQVELTWGAAGVLRDFAASGKGLLIISDGTATPGEVIGKRFFGGGVVLGSPAGIEKNPADVRKSFLGVGNFDVTHPVFSDLGGNASGDAASTRFYNPGGLSVNSPEVQVLMTMSNGAPVLVERGLGEGRVALLACGVNPYSSNIALKPFFLPFLVRMAGYLGGQSAPGRRTFVSGEKIEVRSARSPGNGGLAAFPADGHGRALSLVPSPGTGGTVYRLEGQVSPGVYMVADKQHRGAAVTAFAVNNDAVEGNLTGAEPEVIAKKFAAYSPRFANAPRFFPEEKVAGWAYKKGITYLWIPFALGALLMLVLDTVVSNKR